MGVDAMLWWYWNEALNMTAWYVIACLRRMSRMNGCHDTLMTIQVYTWQLTFWSKERSEARGGVSCSLAAAGV